MKILAVGEHPLSYTGNGNMLAGILADLDKKKHKVAAFVATQINPCGYDIFKPFPITFVNATLPDDYWGTNRLVEMVKRVDFDVLLMVGIDIWRYAQVFPQIIEARDRRKFKWIAIFPYDLHKLRTDWLPWMNAPDVPCVYSQHGYDALKDHVPRLRYFRPPKFAHDFFKPCTKKERAEYRKRFFGTISDDQFIFAYVGTNQTRKDLPRLINAFVQAQKEKPNLVLHLHTTMTKGAYNLKQMAKDYGMVEGTITTKEDYMYGLEDMIKIYGSVDCLVNCSMQEGLSWTPLEAMLCGLPVIASDTTAQTELVKDAGVLVPCTGTSFVKMFTEKGNGFIESRHCSVEDIKKAMLRVASDAKLRARMRKKGLAKAKDWISGMDDINELVETIVVPAKSKKMIDKVLFAQHSSAGDVLMSTQCFKGIKERHPNLELVFMTQSQFQGIVTGNPYVDDIINWDEKWLRRYGVVYNPHGDKILPGGWNNLDVKLHSMYPYFCEVEADDIFIKATKPGIRLPKKYIVVHTTGGAGDFRSYKHMDMVIAGLRRAKNELPIIQIGSRTDLACQNATHDLRGELSWAESAYVLGHASGAVVIDSFPAHLAGAMKTPVVVLFGPAPSRVTGPRGDPDKIVCLEPDMMKVCKILSHCWGNPPPGKEKCMSPCINSINPLTVRDALLTVMKGTE